VVSAIPAASESAGKDRPAGAPGAGSGGLAGEIRRARLHERLDAAITAGRLTLVTAGAGYGKTTLLRAWTADVAHAWHTIGPADTNPGVLARHLVDALRLPVPDLSAEMMVAASRVRTYSSGEPGGSAATAAALAEALDGTLSRRTVLVLDDLDELAGSPAAVTLIDAFIRQVPPLLHVIAVGRDQPPFRTARMLAHGEATEIDAAELAFTPAEIADLAVMVPDAKTSQLAPAVHRITGGWPVATRLALEALGGAEDQSQLLHALEEPRGLLLRYMADEVIGREPGDVLELLQVAQVLDGFDAAMLAAVGVPGAQAMLTRLSRRGLYLEEQSGRPGRFVVRPLLRSYLARHGQLSSSRRRQIMAEAAAWHDEAGEHAEALAYAARLEDAALCAEWLSVHGPLLVASGEARVVLAASAQVPAERRTAGLEVVVGDAELLAGEWDAALARYQQAAGGDVVPAAVAWRIGLLHYLRGELPQAVEVFERGDDEDQDLAARALLLAWSASAKWLRGDLDRCRELATRAMTAARGSRDHQALAAAHTVLAMLAAVDGDRAGNDAHYLRALDHATAAHDVLQLVRIHANRSSQRLEEGDAAGALMEVDLAVKLADLAGFATFRALALSNRGQALLALGRLDEARVELAASRTMFDRLGSAMASYPSSALGDVHLLRGERGSAREAYQRAVTLSRQVSDAQGLVPALTGQAKLAMTEDLTEALALIDEALGMGVTLGRVNALVTAARIKLAAGDPGGAIVHATEARDKAEEQRDRAGLAEATEALAEATGDRAAALAAVRQWQALEDPIGASRARLLVARLEEMPEPAIALAQQSADEAQEVGAREVVVAAGALLDELRQGSESADLVLRCLGGFAVAHGGEVVPASAWQSRKARDLLKVLVCRDGRPIHREQLLELLWPGEDPARTGNRLSVALSTVRGVLDPAHRHPSDHHVRTEGDSVTLANVDTDVGQLLDKASRGLSLARSGAVAEARTYLEAAELAYAGDLLEEDPYSEWVVDLRERARLTYLDVVRKLAELGAADGDYEAAIRYLLRLLERDPYDETAHLDLVRLLAEQGRHGEARRRYRLYARRLGEIGVEPTPYPATARSRSTP
jgi:ATP/maltotriose-dependent transcriptional regulator MalT/DNA-binding SARP family transcriptional activator